MVNEHSIKAKSKDIEEIINDFIEKIIEVKKRIKGS
jgi:hypothetical protein